MEEIFIVVCQRTCRFPFARKLYESELGPSSYLTLSANQIYCGRFCIIITIIIIINLLLLLLL